MVLSRFAFWTHRATRASYDYRGRRCPLCCQAIPRQARGFGDMLCCGCQAPPGRPHRVRQRGLQVVVTRAWCGAEGFTFRLESEDDWVGIAPLRLVPLMKFSCCCLPSMRLPSGGRGRAMGPAAVPTCGYQRGAELMGEIRPALGLVTSVWDPWGACWAIR